MVAFAAAQETGFPPNVLACAPGGHDMISARAHVTPSGSPDAMPLAMLTTSAFRSKCSRGEHLPRPPHAGLHFVDDQHDAVLGRQLAQSLQERLRRNDVSAFPLDRLDDDGGRPRRAKSGGRGSGPLMKARHSAAH